MTNLAIEVCKAFIERSDELGYKGKARDKAALDYIIGAAKVLQLLSEKETSDVLLPELARKSEHLARIAFIISIRGYSEVVAIANKVD